ncbi:S-layer homology domain-containing protein [Bacillus sp. CGMCC 1.16541]|uniref:S-layer homology domain-containing protein n=1 Tax=Bacillus sp. CGMCC 1.16541 TaxID=2185143 RepID=UPI000D73025B|nr:S-layer homology domain-containing protein [Bacillus sp. CGMCC 1.16541]
MKKIRIWIALILSLTLTLQVSSVSAANKTSESYLAYDIVNHHAYNELDDFMAADIIDGTLNEHGLVEIKPNHSVTRAQFTKILVNALNLKASASSKTFIDVKKDDWHYEYITIASSLGIVTGREDGKFYPYEQIKREHMAAMIHRAFKNSVAFKRTNTSFKDVPATHWAYKEINEASSVGIINGYTETNEFRPLNKATRAQAVLMIHRALKQETKNTPTAQSIEKFMRGHVDAEMSLLRANDFSALETLFNKNTTGFYRTVGLESIDMYKLFADMGATLSIEPVGTYTISITHLNDRYVQVETKNAKQKVHIKQGTSTYKDTLDVSGVYSLRKDLSGNWKIYNYIPTDESLANRSLFGL